MDELSVFGIMLAEPDRALVFLSQFILSVFVFMAIARPMSRRWLSSMSATAAMSILLLPHAFRHLGLAFLVPGLVEEGLPSSFAVPAGYGDLSAGLLAVVALIALRQRSRLAVPLIWIFSIVGIADLANALRQVEAVNFFISTWYIPTFVVPLLLTTHFMIVVRLLRGETSHELSTNSVRPDPAQAS